MKPEHNISLLIEEAELEHKKFVLRYRQYEALYNQVIDAIPTDTLTNVRLSVASLDLTVAGGREALFWTFRALRQHEFTPTERPKAGEATYASYFSHTSGARIWLYFTSTQCQRVQVGTKTVIEPVYELRCEDQVHSPPPGQVGQDPLYLSEENWI